MNLTIIPVSKSKLQEWVELRHKLWPKYSLSELTKDASSMIKKRNQKAFLAVKDTKVVGFLECSIKSWAHGCKTKRIGYVEGWYIEPDYREQGIGSKLVKFFEKWAKNKNCLELASDCYLENNVSYKSHIALGYKEHNRLINFSKKI